MAAEAAAGKQKGGNANADEEAQADDAAIADEAAQVGEAKNADEEGAQIEDGQDQEAAADQAQADAGHAAVHARAANVKFKKTRNILANAAW